MKEDSDLCPYKVMQCGYHQFCDHKRNKNRQFPGKGHKMRDRRSICLHLYKECPYKNPIKGGKIKNGTANKSK